MFKKLMIVAVLLMPVATVGASETALTARSGSLKTVQSAVRQAEKVLLARGIKVVGYDKSGKPVIQCVSSPPKRKPTLQDLLFGLEAELNLRDAIQAMQ